MLEHFDRKVRIGRKGIKQVFILEDMLYAQKMYLSAIIDYTEYGGGDRGSAIYRDMCPEKSVELIEEKPRDLTGQVQEIKLLKNGSVETVWRNVRPIPDENNFFENVWKEYRKNKNVK